MIFSGFLDDSFPLVSLKAIASYSINNANYCGNFYITVFSIWWRCTYLLGVVHAHDRLDGFFPSLHDLLVMALDEKL